MKKIPSLPHGVIDYMTAAFFLAAPKIFKFKDKRACGLTAGAGAGCAIMSLMTDYPLGLFKVIPFRVHGAIEFWTSLFMAAAPKAFRFEKDKSALKFFEASAAMFMSFWAASDYRQPEELEGRSRKRVSGRRMSRKHARRPLALHGNGRS